MTRKRAHQRDCEYDRTKTIAELDRWLNRGKAFYPIDTAISALYWLERSWRPTDPTSLLDFNGTLEELRGWLHDDTPELPEILGHEILDWLQKTSTAEALEDCRPPMETKSPEELHMHTFESDEAFDAWADKTQTTAPKARKART